MFLPEYGGHRHNLRTDLIRLSIIRCEFEEINVKFQMHPIVRELASPGITVHCPNIQINDDTFGTSYKAFSIYLESVLYVRTLTDISYFSPLFGIHFQLTACFFY